MTAALGQIAFGPFRCDPLNACVRREEQTVELPPKAFEVLLYLLRHPNQLVSKEELLKTVWAETYIGDAVLKVAIGEIRKALADNAKSPQFIETVHRRGYRFIAPITTAPYLRGPGVRGQGSAKEPLEEVEYSPTPEISSPIPEPRPLAPPLVGRDAELMHLHELLEKALRGERQSCLSPASQGSARRRWSMRSYRV